MIIKHIDWSINECYICSTREDLHYRVLYYNNMQLLDVDAVCKTCDCDYVHTYAPINGTIDACATLDEVNGLILRISL